MNWKQDRWYTSLKLRWEFWSLVCVDSSLFPCLHTLWQDLKTDWTHGSSPQQMIQVCPMAFTAIHAYCFLVETYSVTWDDAHAICQEKSSHLAEPTTSEVNHNKCWMAEGVYQAKWPGGISTVLLVACFLFINRKRKFARFCTWIKACHNSCSNAWILYSSKTKYQTQKQWTPWHHPQFIWFHCRN